MPAQFERLPSDVDPSKLVEILRRDGATVIEGFVPSAVALGIDLEMAPLVHDRRGGFRTGFDSFYGSQTVRVQDLIAHSQLWREHVLGHRAHIAAADALLGPHCGDYWMSQSELIFLGPGQAAQELHRDDLNWAIAATIPDIELQVACLVAVGDYDKAVGATRVVPGSHLWDSKRVPEADEVVVVEMDPGDAVIYTGRTLHGGGANETSDRWRKALYISYLLGWLTPEEAVAVSIPPRIVATLTQTERRLLGWASQPGRKGSVGAEAALGVWQLDADNPHMRTGVFEQR